MKGTHPGRDYASLCANSGERNRRKMFGLIGLTRGPAEEAVDGAAVNYWGGRVSKK